MQSPGQFQPLTTQSVLNNNKTVRKYIEGVEVTSRNTAKEYLKRLSHFGSFISQKYNLTLDELIDTLTIRSRGPKINVYDMFSEYISYIRGNKSSVISPITLKLRVSTVRNFLETFDVEISLRKFQFKVKMPRVVRAHKEPLTKVNIQNILNACSDIRLKTYILFLAATGCRASEALSIRLQDINFESNPSTVFIRGEHTKTKTDRIVMLTYELVKQLRLWLDFKHRTRIVGYYNKEEKKSYHEKRTPTINRDVFIFAQKNRSRSKTDEDAIGSLYNNMSSKFENLLDRLGGKYAEYETIHKRRRKITFHSIRRWVKSVISDLGLEQYSEIYIGHHSQSTYYRISEPDRIKLFRKVEPYLTFLDYASLESKGADLQNRLESMELENRKMRDKMNQVMEMIQQNPLLANVKPEVLTKKGLGSK